ncbi:MOSC domain-containing protein [Pseudomonas typographi]|uniref:MOSC domain-containing protein n=1 Tax=Pseudomonas typographi TaxID=2715964 RepID=A0ABR7Z4B2_9PSED|nr:MOSC domain-containing protein [Pseudomonas typographi]MBD1553230.1 MOSC domain-containing protein [Pseudomonas typographi]MBD1588110.1 MOSC domain-containing protein [Pseudomonas typographi]MBD1600356.1 MOSC domain-containing protein [Pseudomonas typographi]
MQLCALYRYPLKSAIGQTLRQSAVGPLGLAGDRCWMLVEAGNGRFMSQRSVPRLGQLRAEWAADAGLLLGATGHGELAVPLPPAQAPLRDVTVWGDSLRVPDAGDDAAAWLSAFIGIPVRLVHVPAERARAVNPAYAQPGDRVGFADGFPLLLIGQGSLDDLNQRIGRPMEMLRFRPNLVVDGAAPYAEDGWKRLRIGEVTFRVAVPCARCILTTLDPQTGERSADREPLNTLKGYRLREGGIMFGQNLIAEGHGELQVGMAVDVLE